MGAPIFILGSRSFLISGSSPLIRPVLLYARRNHEVAGPKARWNQLVTLMLSPYFQWFSFFPVRQVYIACAPQFHFASSLRALYVRAGFRSNVPDPSCLR